MNANSSNQSATAKAAKTNSISAIKNYLAVVAPKINPASPMKGIGNDRRRISDLPMYRTIRNFIPANHRQTVSIYRGAGYGGDVEFTSPEVFRAIKLIAKSFGL